MTIDDLAAALITVRGGIELTKARVRHETVKSYESRCYFRRLLAGAQDNIQMLIDHLDDELDIHEDREDK